MKKIVNVLLLISFICLTAPVHAQQISQEQAKQMEQKIRGMTMEQRLQYIKQIQQKGLLDISKKLPNGQQLLETHHYENTLTTVEFSYTKTVTSSNNGVSSSETSSCHGSSTKAPMQYDAKGYANVRCNMAAVGPANAASDQMAAGLDKYRKYMAPEQAVQATDASRTMSFSSLTMKDHSLQGTATLDGRMTAPDGHSVTSVKGPVKNISFSFLFDPEQNFGVLGAGATLTKHTEGETSGVPFKRDEESGVGASVRTDPTKANMAGVGMLTGDPGEVFMTVKKTGSGYSITYEKTEEFDGGHGRITESFTATVGEPLEEYEAIIMPMPESKYETWLPKGPKVDGSDDTKGDDSLKFYVIVQDKADHNKRYPGNFTVDYKLSDITHYKGFNSNYPWDGANQDNDFKICDSLFIPPLDMFDRSTATDSTVSTLPGKGAIAVVQLSCMDYGAWAKLSAKITLDNGSAPLIAHPYYSETDQFITAPFDMDKNKLADYWEKHENIFKSGYGLDWDEDVKPNNQHNGDNIPLIDEYRGFLTEEDKFNRVFKRFSPQIKELITIGVLDEGGLNAKYQPAVKAGVLNYGRASQIMVYHLTKARYGKREEGEPAGIARGRWVNYNSPYKIYARGVVIAVNEGKNPTDKEALASTDPVAGATHANLGALLPEETKGINVWFENITGTAYKPDEYLPLNGNPNDPNVIRKIGYIQKANAQFGVNIDPYNASPLVAKYLEKNYERIIEFSVGHELGHATNIHHHHVAEGNIGYFKGTTTCPMRYWMNNHIDDNCSTWVAMYITGNWDPGTFTTPGEHGEPMAFCTVEDNCFSQLQLKKK